MSLKYNICDDSRRLARRAVSAAKREGRANRPTGAMRRVEARPGQGRIGRPGAVEESRFETKASAIYRGQREGARAEREARLSCREKHLRSVEISWPRKPEQGLKSIKTDVKESSKNNLNTQEAEPSLEAWRLQKRLKQSMRSCLVA